MTNAAKSKEQGKPHYHGHRDRLRERFVEGGADALPDYELLELILFTCIPRKDVKPIAKELIAQFGNLSGVVNAALAELESVTGISRNTAIAIKPYRLARCA